MRRARARSYSPNRTFITALIPMFLIISSSVYPAVLSSIENREMSIIGEVVAQIEEDNQIKRGTDTSSDHATIPIPTSHNINLSSPTPIDPSFSSTSFTSIQSNGTPISSEDDNIITPDNVGTSTRPAIAVSGNNVHVVWEDDTPGNFEILYRRSTDGGATFGPTINLSNNVGTSTTPAIAAIDNNVHVVWPDDTPGNADIFYRRSTDGGASFTEPTKNLSNNAGSSFSAAIAVSGNNVHVVWDDTTPGSFDILYRRSVNGGSTFPNVIKNLSSNAGISAFPAIAVSGNNVHVVWNDDTLGNSDILYRRSLDNGSTFPNIIKNLSSNAGASTFPAIAVSGNNVHVVWQDDTPGNPGNPDILYRRSINDGSTFPNIIKNLSSNNTSSGLPAIAVSGNTVHVVWEDNSSGNFDILYRRSIDGGSTFPNIIKNLSSNALTSDFPAIAAIGNNVHVVWDDFTDTQGNPDILYRRSINGGSTFPNVIKNLSDM